MRRRGRWLVLLVIAGWALALDACGSRTGLLIDDTSGQIPTPDGAPPPGDASRDRDATIDRRVPDALPPIDVTTPRDVNRDDCPDADATLVYLVSQGNELFSFYPPTLTFKTIGNLVCPAAPGTTPFSMAVDRKGKAFVVFSDGNLFQVSTATAACVATPFVVGQLGFTTFGMGFASDTNGPAEKLYVDQNSSTGMGRDFSQGLATIDLNTFKLNFIAPFNPPIPGAEFTGTGDGRLFGFYTNNVGTGSRIVEVDKANANVLAGNDLTIGDPNDAFAFAFWGGDFYVFTASNSSNITRYRPSDGTITLVGSHPSTIVGAGVSTCAPQ